MTTPTAVDIISQNKEFFYHLLQPGAFDLDKFIPAEIDLSKGFRKRVLHKATNDTVLSDPNLLKMFMKQDENQVAKRLCDKLLKLDSGPGPLPQLRLVFNQLFRLDLKTHQLLARDADKTSPLQQNLHSPLAHFIETQRSEISEINRDFLDFIAFGDFLDHYRQEKIERLQKHTPKLQKTKEQLKEKLEQNSELKESQLEPIQSKFYRDNYRLIKLNKKAQVLAEQNPQALPPLLREKQRLEINLEMLNKETARIEKQYTKSHQQLEIQSMGVRDKLHALNLQINKIKFDDNSINKKMLGSFTPPRPRP